MLAPRMVLVGLLTMASTGAAFGQPGLYPDPATYEAKKAEFTQLLPAKFTQEERAAARRECLARQGGVDPADRCDDWYASEAWYDFGWTACRGLSAGYPRSLVLKELLLPEDARFNQAILATALEVLCPEFAGSADGSRRRQPPPPRETAEPGEWKPDPDKDRQFIDAMIRRLPGDAQKDLRDVCKNYDQHCPLWGLSAFGDRVCEELGQGRGRKEVRESMAGFFKPSEDRAIVDSAIEVICPQYSGEN